MSVFVFNDLDAFCKRLDQLEEIRSRNNIDPQAIEDAWVPGTVETCALVIGLWACKDEIWDRYSKEEQDSIAAFLSGYANAATVPQNWRLFNMLDIRYLHRFKALQKTCNTTLNDAPKQCLMKASVRL